SRVAPPLRHAWISRIERRVARLEHQRPGSRESARPAVETKASRESASPPCDAVTRQKKDRRRLPNRRLRSREGGMEPFGFVRPIRYGTLIQGRDAGRLRKRYRGRPNRPDPKAVRQSRSMSPAAASVRSARPPLVIALVVVLLVAACGSNPSSPTATPVAPSPAPSVPVSPTPGGSAAAPSASSTAAADAVYDEIEKQVVEIRGLPAKKPVPREFI